MRRTEDTTHIFKKTERYKNGMGANAFLKELEGAIEDFKKHGWKNVRIVTKQGVYSVFHEMKGEK